MPRGRRQRRFTDLLLPVATHQSPVRAGPETMRATAPQDRSRGAYSERALAKRLPRSPPCRYRPRLSSSPEPGLSQSRHLTTERPLAAAHTAGACARHRAPFSSPSSLAPGGSDALWTAWRRRLVGRSRRVRGAVCRSVGRTGRTHALASLSVADCPGISSAQAGRAAACQGCPNQGLCAAGTAPDPGERGLGGGGGPCVWRGLCSKRSLWELMGVGALLG